MTTAAAAASGGAVDLAVAETGHGGRPLLLVHGFTGAKEDFVDFMDRFAEAGWWTVAPDLRGHGGSPKPDAEEAYSVAHYAADLWALVESRGWSSFDLLGHSMGGMVAQELALAAPERIGRLVLMDTHHGSLDVVDPQTASIGADIVRDQGLPELLRLLEQLAGERAPAEQRVRAERPGYEEWNRSKVDACAPAMYAAMLEQMSVRPDRLRDLAALDVPTRIVVGEQDRGFLAPSRRMADVMPRADLVVIPDAAHSPQFENPAAWWDAVAGFLAG